MNIKKPNQIMDAVRTSVNNCLEFARKQRYQMYFLQPSK
ncbi:MAG: hypothetical protein ACI85Q_002619, partial [Salibacteraceae bacterium]